MNIFFKFFANYAREYNLMANAEIHINNKEHIKDKTKWIPS